MSSSLNCTGRVIQSIEPRKCLFMEFQLQFLHYLPHTLIFVQVPHIKNINFSIFIESFTIPVVLTCATCCQMILIHPFYFDEFLFLPYILPFFNILYLLNLTVLRSNHNFTISTYDSINISIHADVIDFKITQ